MLGEGHAVRSGDMVPEAVAESRADGAVEADVEQIRNAIVTMNSTMQPDMAMSRTSSLSLLCSMRSPKMFDSNWAHSCAWLSMAIFCSM